MSAAVLIEPDAELIARLRDENARLTVELRDAQDSLKRLRTAYNKALEELLLHKQRLSVAKAERRDSTEDQLAFDAVMLTVKNLAEQLQVAEDSAEQSAEQNADSGAAPSTAPPTPPTKDPKTKPARRNLEESDLPLVRVELRDELLDKTAEFIAFETTWKLGYQRGGERRIQIDRAIYKTCEAGKTLDEPAQFETTPMPKEIVRRGLLAPSMIAHVLGQKFIKSYLVG